MSNKKDEVDDDLKKEVQAIDHGLKNEPDPTPRLGHIESILQAILTTKFSANRASTEYIFKTMLPKFVVTLLKRSDLDEDLAPRVNQFFQAVIDFALALAPHDIPETLDLIGKLFTTSPQFSFYMKFGKDFNQEDMYNEDAENAESEFTSTKGADVWDTSSFLLQNVNHFGKRGGFQIILARLRKADPKPSMLITKLLLKPVAKAREYLNPAFLKPYVDELAGIIPKLILGMTDEELKVEDRKVIADVSKYFELLIKQTNTPKASETAEKLNLEIADKCFKCPYLEKRLCGLNEIKDFIQSVQRYQELMQRMKVDRTMAMNVSHYYPSMWLTSKYLVQWLKEKKVLEHLYGDNMHPELIKRCVEVPKFLLSEGALDQSQLKLIWDASLGKHESIQHVIYSTVADLAASGLPVEAMDFLFEQIKSIPLAEYDTQTVHLVKSFSVYGISATMPKPKWYGVSILWDLIQDEAPVSNDVATQALGVLHEFLRCYANIRQQFIEGSIANLRNHTSVPQSLKVLSKIIESFAEKRKRDSLQTTIEWMNSNHQVLDLLFKDLQHYRQHAKEAAQKLLAEDKNANLNEAALVGKYPHLRQVKERLDFLDYLLSNSSLTLSVEQASVFWQCIIIDALTQEEKDLGFGWLEQARGRQHVILLSEEATAFLFTQKAPEMDFGSLSYKGFSFFELFLRWVNWKHNRFEQHDTVYVVKSLELAGMDTLWRIALETRDPIVGSAAIQFLNKLHKYLSPDLKVHAPAQREKYIKVCMEHLTEAASKLAVAADPALELRINRCLTIIKTILDEFEPASGSSRRHGASSKGTPITLSIFVLQGAKYELKVHTNETIGALRQKIAQKQSLAPSGIRLITAGREIVNDHETLSDAKIQDKATVHVAKRITVQDQPQSPSRSLNTPQSIEMEDREALPSEILSDQKYFNQLFQLLTLPGEGIGQQVWDLLMMLPTNSKMLNDLSNLVSGAQPNWAELLDSRSIYKLLYSLQIVDSLVHSSDESKDQTQITQWCTLFVMTGGLKHMVNILMTTDLQDPAKGNKRQHCASLLLKLINFFLLQNVPEGTLAEASAPPSLKDYTALAAVVRPTDLIQKLLDITFKTALKPLFPAPPTIVQEAAGEGEQAPVVVLKPRVDSPDEEVVHHGLSALVAITLTDPTLLTFFLQHAYLDQWLQQVVLTCSEQRIREEAAAAIYLLCTTVKTAVPATPHTFFLNKLLSFLPAIDPRLSTSEQYFSLLNQLVKDSCEGTDGGNPSKFAALLVALIDMIKKHPVVEARHTSQEDKVLIGLLNLVCTLTSKSEVFKADAGPAHKGGLVQHVFHACLFDIPTVDNHGPYAPPKCKSKNSRNIAFKLLIELCKNNLENFKELTDKLLEQHHDGDKRHQWKYLPSGHEKAEVGYVGMKNLGATCYMNSLMQQLYMVPEFRCSLFQAVDKEENRAESLLYQMQAIFGNLQESEKKYYDTWSFCTAYKPDGQPMNPSQQMDADEFFNMLFDKLENSLKGTKDENLLKEYFGGVLSNQVISKECDHISERDESFFTLGLEIKNKKSILESLDLYVEGDMLVGDNKYFCGSCSQKRDAVKRVCINTLPNNLIVHLKRFEFDIETMKRMKVNDHCEFPTTLNMEPYTKEGLTRKEAMQAFKEGRTAAPPPDPVHPPSFYDYELVGILVHTGTADSGHYYSFIKERNPGANGESQWLHFNDTLVEPFDPKEIARACYGGTEHVSQWDPTLQKHVTRLMAKPHSAYMLFYKRVNPPKESQKALNLTPASQLVPPEIFKSIWDENMSFLHDKNIFDPSYFQFLWKIVKLDQSPPVEDWNAVVTTFDPAMRTIQLATKFIVETLSHAKEKTNLKEYVDYLKSLYSRHLPACRWFLETTSKDPVWLKQLLLVCTVPEPREAFASLITHILSTVVISTNERSLYDQEEDAMEVVVEDEAEKQRVLKLEEENPLAYRRSGCSKSLVIRFMDAVLGLLREAHMYWRNFTHYFLVMEDFASFGPYEREYFVSRRAVAQFIDFYLGEESPLARIKRSKKTKMGDKFTAPQVSHMLGTISILARGATTEAQVESTPVQLPERPVTLSDLDNELLYCQVFYARAVKDNVNPKAIADLVVHICWENDAMSAKIADMIAKGIDAVDYDGFKPYFDVFAPFLAMQDSIQPRRVDHALSKYLKTVHKNIKFKNATYHSIKFLAGLDIPAVTQWLFDNRDRWLEQWLCVSFHDAVRDIAEQLVMHVTDEFQGTSTDPVIAKRVSTLYTTLLGMLPKLGQYTKGDAEIATKTDDSGYGPAFWRLSGFFRVLRWCVRSHADKVLFWQHHFTDFINLFIQQDALHLECDENKKEMTTFWLAVLQDYPDGVKQITSDVKLVGKMLDFFISLRPSERFIYYNNMALPSWYNILLLTADDKAFLDKLLSHRNFDWAVRYLYLDSLEYRDVVPVLTEILKKGTAHSPEHRQRHIPWLIQNSTKIQTTYWNILKYADLLIKTTEDAALFCEHGGLETLSALLESKTFEREITEDLCKVMEMCLDLLIRASSWMLNDYSAQPKAARAIQEIHRGWESKLGLLTAVLTFPSLFSNKGSILAKSYILIENLCAMDKNCLEQALSYLHQQHDSFATSKQIDNSESSRGLRKSQIMDTDDVASQESYYEFVLSICRLAFTNLQSSESAAHTVELCTFVACETAGLPMHDHAVKELHKMWDATGFFIGVLKESRLLDSYVTKIFMQHIQQLDNPDCHAFMKMIFPVVQERLGRSSKQAIIDALVDRLSSTFKEATGAPQHFVATIARVVKALHILFPHNELRAQFLETGKAVLPLVYELPANKDLSAVERFPELVQLIKTLRERFP